METPRLNVEQLELMPTPSTLNKQAFPLSKGKWEADQKRACLLKKKKKSFKNVIYFPVPETHRINPVLQLPPQIPPPFAVPSLQPTRASPLPGWEGCSHLPPHYNEQRRRGPWLTNPGPPARRQTWLQAQGWENGEMKGWGEGARGRRSQMSSCE